MTTLYFLYNPSVGLRVKQEADIVWESVTILLDEKANRYYLSTTDKNYYPHPVAYVGQCLTEDEKIIVNNTELHKNKHTTNSALGGFAAVLNENPLLPIHKVNKFGDQYTISFDLQTRTIYESHYKSLGLSRTEMAELLVQLEIKANLYWMKGGTEVFTNFTYDWDSVFSKVPKRLIRENTVPTHLEWVVAYEESNLSIVNAYIAIRHKKS